MLFRVVKRHWNLMGSVVLVVVVMDDIALGAGVYLLIEIDKI